MTMFFVLKMNKNFAPKRHISVKCLRYVWIERTVGNNDKLENFKLESPKLESFCLSWKEPSEIWKNPAKLERTELNWKEPSEVGKLNQNSPISSVALQLRLSFLTSARTFQLQLELSKFSANFPTSVGSFQLQSFQFHFGLFNLKLSNFSFFPTALSNSMYPEYFILGALFCDYCKKVIIGITRSSDKNYQIQKISKHIICTRHQD